MPKADKDASAAPEQQAPATEPTPEEALAPPAAEVPALPPPTQSVQAEPDAYDLTLDEFCQRRSANDRRVELLHGFRADQRAKGRVKDTETGWVAALNEFAARPVT